MTLAVEKVMDQLRAEFGYVRVKNDSAWICCPFHGERSPSLKFNLDPTNAKAGVGFSYCFGCDHKGPWGLFVEKYNKDYPSSKLVKLEKADHEIREVRDSRKKLRKLATQLQSHTMESVAELFGGGIMMDPYEDWRSIPLKVLQKANAKVFADRSGTTSMLLPCYVQGELVGGISARIIPSEDKKVPNYLNSAGEWTKDRGLYPFDLARERMKVWKTRTIVLGEGPRDALNLLSNGIPTVSILGIKNWTETKRQLLLSMEPKKIIVCMDGDRAGIKATNQLVKELDPFCDTDFIDTKALTKKYGKKIDGGNAPDEMIEELLDMVYPKRAVCA